MEALALGSPPDHVVPWHLRAPPTPPYKWLCKYQRAKSQPVTLSVLRSSGQTTTRARYKLASLQMPPDVKPVQPWAANIQEDQSRKFPSLHPALLAVMDDDRICVRPSRPKPQLSFAPVQLHLPPRGSAEGQWGSSKFRAICFCFGPRLSVVI